MSEVAVTVKNQSIRVTTRNDRIYIRFLETNTLQTISGGGGSGDVLGPSSSTNNTIVLFDGVTGKLIKDSATPISSLQTALGFTPSRRIIYKNNNVSSSLTGTTNETVMDSVLIPAGTLAANDIVYIKAIFTKSGTAGILTAKFRINTQANGPVIGTSTQVALGATTGGTNIWYGWERSMYFKNALNSIVVVNATNNFTFDLSQVTNAKTTLTNDFSAAQYIFITGQLGSAADTLTLESWMIEAIRT